MIFLNMKLLSKLFITSLICVLSCSSEETEETACIDETKIDGLVLCIEVYEPVCGCNGITYPNVCYASSVGGVTSFISGPCVKPD